MSFTSKQVKLLYQLEFSQEEINTQLAQLSEEELSAAIKRQRRIVSAKYHPDRTNGDPLLTKKFLQVTNAAEELLNSQGLTPSLLEAITPFDYQIPLDCIDHRIKEQLDDYFEEMTNYFSSLPSKNEQQQFIDENKTSLQFALWLHQHSTEIRKIRDEAFYKTVHAPSLFNTIKQEMNKLIIQFFGEEDLNDIIYREAIALGNLNFILASRKLFSPIKWLGFVVCATYDALTTGLTYGLQSMIKDMSKDLAALSDDGYRAVPFLAKMFALIALFAIPIVLLPQLVMFMLVLPLLTRSLFYLANPVNQIIRPLSEYFKIAPIWVGLATAGMGVAALGGTLLLSSSMIEVLLVLASVTSILSLIASAMVLKKLYEYTPEVALTLGGLAVSLTLLQLFIPVEAQPVVDTLTGAIINLLSELSVLGINVLGYQHLSNIKENLSAIYMSLPLPAEEAPEVVKQVVGEVSQKNYWSYTLFNSPLQRNVPTAQEKISRHSMGLFGRSIKQLEYPETAEVLDPCMTCN